MEKMTSLEFHALFEGIVSAGEVIGYGKQTEEAFRRGWATAMDRVYARLVDPKLDAEQAESEEHAESQAC